MTTIVTHIEPDPKEPDLRVISTTDRGRLTVRNRDIDESELREGDTLSSDDWDDLTRRHQITLLRLRAIRSLSRAPASRARLTARLTEHGTLDEIDRALDELESDGILNDAAFAAQIVKERLRKQPVGRDGIAQTLKKRGIAEAIIEETMQALIDCRDQRADAEAAADMAMRGLENLPVDTAARRLAGRLARRGFDEETIMEVVKARMDEQ